jgi:hypothetical protein
MRPSGSLMDGGANGGLSGSDVLLLRKPFSLLMLLALQTILYRKSLCALLLAIFIIGIFHQYAHHGTGKTIRSVSQLCHFGTIVDDTPRCLNGKQRLETLDGYIIPLIIRSGLPYMDILPLSLTPILMYSSHLIWNGTHRALLMSIPSMTWISLTMTYNTMIIILTPLMLMRR